MLPAGVMGRPDAGRRMFRRHVTGSGTGGGRGGGRSAADDVGVVSGVDHVHGELGQRAKRLAALDAA